MSAQRPSTPSRRVLSPPVPPYRRRGNPPRQRAASSAPPAGFALLSESRVASAFGRVEETS